VICDIFILVFYHFSELFIIFPFTFGFELSHFLLDKVNLLYILNLNSEDIHSPLINKVNLSLFYNMSHLQNLNKKAIFHHRNTKFIRYLFLLDEFYLMKS
jgi:hypothetical protein